jgi:surface polysaccharide O-acyltransferase-like enzyme
MAFMVVGIHAGFLGDLSLLGQHLTVNGLFRLAVPIFLIINGYYFFYVMSKDQQFNWLKRISILYIVWMVFYSYFWFSTPDFSLIGFAKFIKQIIIGYHHLWYVSGMIGGALLLMVFSGYSSKILIVSIIFTFLIGVFIQYLGNYHILENTIFYTLFNYNWVHRNMVFFSYPFFCIGYLINKHSLHNKITLKFASGLSILGLIFLFTESYINYHQESSDRGIDNLISLLFVCPFVFISFIKINISGSSKNLALYSSAIYFIHVFVLFFLRKLTELDVTSLTLATILASVFFSYFIIKANERLKFIL